MNKRENVFDEEKIINKCKTDLNNFKDLYNKYFDEVYKYIYAVVNNKTVTEDISSKTFLTALEKIQDFQWRGISIKYWFFSIARNLMYENFNQNKSMSLKEDIQIEDKNKISHDEKIIKEQIKRRMNTILNNLNPKDREIIMLRIWEEMSFKDIGRLLEIKEGTARVRYHRALKKVKDVMTSDDKKLLSISDISSIKPMLVDALKNNTPKPSSHLKSTIKSKINSKIKLYNKKDMSQKSKPKKNGDLLSKVSKTMSKVKFSHLVIGGAVLGIAVVSGIYLEQTNNTLSTTLNKVNNTIGNKNVNLEYWTNNKDGIWIDAPTKKIEIESGQEITVKGHLTKDISTENLIVKVNSEKKDIQIEFEEDESLNYFEFVWTSSESGDFTIEVCTESDSNINDSIAILVTGADDTQDTTVSQSSNDDSLNNTSESDEDYTQNDSNQEGEREDDEDETDTPADTTAPSSPNLVKPIDSESLACTSTVELDWDSVNDESGIDNYTIVVESHYGDNNWQPISESPSTTPSTNYTINSECALYYRWKVRATDNSGNVGEYSEWEYFQVTLM